MRDAVQAGLRAGPRMRSGSLERRYRQRRRNKSDGLQRQPAVSPMIADAALARSACSAGLESAGREPWRERDEAPQTVSNPQRCHSRRRAELRRAGRSCATSRSQRAQCAGCRVGRRMPPPSSEGRGQGSRCSTERSPAFADRSGAVGTIKAASILFALCAEQSAPP